VVPPTPNVSTKPPAFDQQGVTTDNLIDFTPELRQEAIRIISQYRYGPLFTPRRSPTRDLVDEGQPSSCRAS